MTPIGCQSGPKTKHMQWRNYFILYNIFVIQYNVIFIPTGIMKERHHDLKYIVLDATCHVWQRLATLRLENVIRFSGPRHHPSQNGASSSIIPKIMAWHLRFVQFTKLTKLSIELLARATNKSELRKSTAHKQRSIPLWRWISLNMLTHWGLVMPYGDRDLGQHWLR